MKVFISHAHEDMPLARTLADHLSKAGFDVFDGSQLLPGDNAAKRIGEALDESDAIVVLISPAASRSPSVRGEVQYAIGLQKYEGRLIPVVAEPSEDMPWILGKLPTIKINGDMSRVAREIVDRLQAAPV